MLALGSAFSKSYETLVTESEGNHQRLVELEKESSVATMRR